MKKPGAEQARLFIAIPLEQRCLDALTRAQSDLREQTPERSVRWVRPGNMHITLHFLGDTPAQSIPLVEQAVREGSAGRAPVSLVLRGAGAFPGARRPRVVWAGVEDPDGGLARIHDGIRGALEAHGFAVDRRRFRPHITLGYVRRSASASAVRMVGDLAGGPAREQTVAGTHFTASEVVLMQSTLSPGGSVYTTLYSASLSDASSTTSSGERARE